MSEFPLAIKNLIAAFERLPGIGPKSAARLVFYLLNTPESYVDQMARLLVALKKDIKICQECFSVSEEDVCLICQDKKRDRQIICVVERALDVMAIENIGGFKGIYHVLGGVINPLEHVSPDDLTIYQLIERIKKLNKNPSVTKVTSPLDEGETLKTKEEIEIILATNPTMEGEATALYIKKRINEINNSIKITRIGSGLPMGADLEYADQATLSRAMDGRRDI